MVAQDRLTQAQLCSVLYYDKHLGWFMWLVAPQIAGKVKPGDSAGRLDSKGYVRIGLFGRQYRAHRLAWLYVTGSWPEQEIDHIDRQRANNIWANLRVASSGQNKQNVAPRRDNTSGVIGVSWSTRRGVWVAQITHKGVRRTLGSFASFNQAKEARQAAEKSRFTHGATR